MAEKPLDQSDVKLKSQSKKKANKDISSSFNKVPLAVKKNGRAEKMFHASRKTKATATSQNPPQELLHGVLRHFQNGRYVDAEKLAASVTQEFPKHQAAWKVLGLIFEATGRKTQAVHAKQTAVALSPRDPEAHYNLGNTLKDIGRLDEAEESYLQAIALKPDHAEAHNNLGVTLHGLGRFVAAETSYAKAISSKPD